MNNIPKKKPNDISEIDWFWQHVDKKGPNECWLWQRSTGTNGHGQIYIKSQNRPIGTHRFAYEITYGKIPKGKRVLHKDSCIKLTCCNPNHLYLGTYKEIAQKAHRFRYKKYNRKFNWFIINNIRSIPRSEKRIENLSKHYEVSRSYINKIYTNEEWENPYYIPYGRFRSRNRAKLVRKLVKSGVSQVRAAGIVGLTASAVSRIVNNNRCIE